MLFRVFKFLRWRELAADDCTTVLGDDNVNAVATALELVGQNAAVQESLAAVYQRGNLASTFRWNACSDFDGAASAWVDDTPSYFNRRSGAAYRCWLAYRGWLAYGGWLAANRCWLTHGCRLTHRCWFAANRGWFADRFANRGYFAAIVLVLAAEKASLSNAGDKHARYSNSANSNQNSFHQSLS